jgi:hypothetical protein
MATKITTALVAALVAGALMNHEALARGSLADWLRGVGALSIGHQRVFFS